MVARVKVISNFGETIERGQSSSINVANTINFLIENIRIQASFSHIKNYNKDYFYSTSDEVVDDIGDDIFVFIIDYIFEYPKMNGQRKYKYINVKGRRYVQEWRQVNGKYRFTKRIPVKGLRKDTKRKIEVSRELM